MILVPKFTAGLRSRHCFCDKKLAKRLKILKLYLAPFIELLMWGGDFAHANAACPQGYVASNVLQLFHKRRLVTAPHENDICAIKEIGRGLSLDPVISRNIGLVLFRGDLITSISTSIRCTILGFGNLSGRIEDIPDGVDCE